MLIFRAIARECIITLAALWRAAIASVALAIMIPAGTGFARTVGAPGGLNRDSSRSLTASAAWTQPCGVSNLDIMPDLTCHEQDNGKTVEIKAESRIAIDLKENPTTGYKWTHPVFDEKVLTFVSSEFRSGQGSGIGGGGIRQFVFIAKSQGKTSVELVNKRSWEKAEAATAKFRMTITIVKQ